MLIAVHEERSLALKEYTVSLLLVCIGEGSFAVHLAVLPLSGVGASVGPLESSISVSLVIKVVALVNSAIRPGVLASTVHVARMPFSYILSPVQPFISPVTLHLVVDPVS